MLFLCLLIFVANTNGEEGAQYLENVIRDLKEMNGQTTAPTAERRVVHLDEHEPPKLDLTKGELAAIYENALLKGDTVQLGNGNDSFINAAVHELDDVDHYSNDKNEDTSGYYYYFYPIKSFIDEVNSQPSSFDMTLSAANHHSYTPKPNYQYHSHTHQHNVKITSTKEMEPAKKKALEPLFMAISGFIGMAVMFVLSVLVLPKFGMRKPMKNLKKNQKLNDIARIALRAIEGEDCTERFACELEKTARTFHLQDNRFVKLIKRIAPITFGRQMNKLQRNKVLRCTAIPCRKKTNQTQQKKKNPGKKA